MIEVFSANTLYLLDRHAPLKLRTKKTTEKPLWIGDNIKLLQILRDKNLKGFSLLLCFAHDVAAIV